MTPIVWIYLSSYALRIRRGCYPAPLGPSTPLPWGLRSFSTPSQRPYFLQSRDSRLALEKSLSFEYGDSPSQRAIPFKSTRPCSQLRRTLQRSPPNFSILSVRVCKASELLVTATCDATETPSEARDKSDSVRFGDIANFWQQQVRTACFNGCEEFRTLRGSSLPSRRVKGM